MEAEGKRRLLPIRVAVIRDTWTNLERTTLVSFEDNAAKGLPIQWINGKRECKVGQSLYFYFFGMDNRADCDKLQGFQCGVLWLEEVAPAAELAVGIPSETLAIGITSVRQPGVPKRVLVTFNPPDEDHWILAVEKTLEEAGKEDILVQKFVIPAGEKSEHFRNMSQLAAQHGDTRRALEFQEAAGEFDAYRSRNRLALEAIGRYDLIDRLVLGKVGGVALGESIVPMFSADQHVSALPLVAVPNIEIIRCWDGGLTPSTVWLQVLPNGGINILGSVTSVNTGMVDHIRNEVYSWQTAKKLFPKKETMEGSERHQSWGPGASGFYFRDIGDPALLQGNAIQKAELTASYVIENMLGAVFEPGPIPWSARREALTMNFNQLIGTKQSHMSRPKILIDRENNKMLIQALNGRARYATNPTTGRINPSIEAAKRESGIWLQALDALGYGLAVIAPAHEFMRPVGHGRSQSSKLPPPRSWVGL